MLYYQVLCKGFWSVPGVHRQLLTLSQHPLSLRDNSGEKLFVVFKGTWETQGPTQAKLTESKWG